ncbi:hypothetical protein THAPSDRAFT_260890 [Thalassiosira pseudonana CCMP1335]|uniref:Spindle assembly checkpoint component MAD1 n=1 Tax=Thalassiosira pseudonana TaxID=35128 RepID=B8BQI5_THAPS|nr:hypothetical protein THAPSDRAFT_260890 [Thalassiosira pseudonana CCMP1335]EED96370.1 hypothetical protein THAPSDRAFT_260890 [Thalassiosira pseudonana CCMP1335]
MDHRKRPRLHNDGEPQPSSSAIITSSTSTSTSSNNTAARLLETELKTLRTELTHSQSIRAIERKNSTRSIDRLKRQLSDAYDEITQNSELIDSLREEIDLHESRMEEMRREWGERIEWYEEQFEILESGGGAGDGVVGGIAEDRGGRGGKTERTNREIKRQNDELKKRLQDMVQHKERAASSQRRLQQLESELQTVTRQIEEGEETQRRWMLELENRKLIAQQQIWQRESEGMRSLLDTYEQQETVLAKSSKTSRSTVKLDVPSKTDESSPSVQGLQLSLKSAREEVKLLSETNKRLETDLEALRTEHRASQTELERVLDKFGKLRNALMEERSKAEASEARACRAETLAGKGSYNEDTTRVVHLKSNPLSEAVREKYKTEIDSLKQRLEEAEETIRSSAPMAGASTPAPLRVTGSFGSAGGSSSGKKGEEALSLDAKKLHKRLKEQFKEQIALFREGVHLVTGYKIDMLNSDTDPLFKVRSIYGEREEDHLMFRWPRKTVGPTAPLDMMNSEMAQLLMQGQSEVYISKCNSIPAFMAAVTLDLFDKQTVL